ncbi:MAG TPA: HD domain-containing protein [Bacteroidales bacterium]|nr:HD domain-containing protein [Bacteroidales bacterium]
MNKNKSLIQSVAKEVKDLTEGEGTGHDWWHLYRVWKLTQQLMRDAQGNSEIAELAALTHDLADHKLTDPDKGVLHIRELLSKHGAKVEVIEAVIDIAKNISFKGAAVNQPKLSPEGMIVQDADRLDAIGAIGVARTFAYGGSKARAIYDPDINPEMHQSFEDYKKSTAPTINHFYEKLLLLKDRLNTPQAKRIAEERHAFMEQFLERFYQEWEGEK